MLSKIKEEALKESVPIIKDGGLVFLLETIQANSFKDILELGTAVGYSSIQMASLDPAISIDTIEKDEEMYAKALQNIEAEGKTSQIHVHFMPIEEFRTERKYDLIFVDAAKAQYGKYMEQFLENLKEDGLFVFDNMIFHGLIWQDNIESRSLRSLVRKINAFRTRIVEDKRFDAVFYDNIGDGILVLKRR